ncbi:lamin tail domain-containing protein [bacterium]|nr:lamin tail domain-containing protein [bacterium]
MKKPLFLLPILALFLLTARAQNSAIISEFMASNLEALEDDDDDSSDWIEFYNPTGSAINLQNHFLTDDERNLRKWKVPGSLNVSPGGYGLLFASGKDRGGLFASTFHTNFELSESGEYLALVAPDGETVLSEFASKYPKQRVGLSYGIADNESAGTEERYFETPTPRAANGPGRVDLPPRVADTKFSMTRGFYDEPITVEITTETEGAVIYYSTDGSDPSKGSVFVPGNIYVEPLIIDETTVLRARAFKDGIKLTNIDTNTYIFTSSVIHQPVAPVGYPDKWEQSQRADYEMDPDVVDDPAYKDEIEAALKDIPSISVVSDPDNLFGRDGLYLNVTRRPTQGDGADFKYEYGVSAEFLSADGKALQIQCGLRSQGGASRNPGSSPKHAMSLRFRNAYGAGKLAFPLLKDSPQTEFNSIQLRARYNNTWHHSNGGQQGRAQLIRDQFARDTALDMGFEGAGHGNYFHLYLNGLYWGIYNVHERMDHTHYAFYYGGQAGEIDALNGGSATNGSTSEYRDMKSAVSNTNTPWERIEELVDIDDYIDWTIVQRWMGNHDLKDNGNWKAAGGGPDSLPWRFFLWDTERIIEEVTFGAPTPQADPTGILNDLADHPEFVRRFGDRLQKHMFNGGALTAEANISRWKERADELHLAMIAESARWGDYRRANNPYTRDDDWLTEQKRILENFFPNRGEKALENFEGWGLYPSVAGVDLGQVGGAVAQRFTLKLSSKGVSLFSPGKIYYTLNGNDPSTMAREVDQEAIEYSSGVTLTDSAWLKARVRTANGDWSALTESYYRVGVTPASAENTVISEVMYHPAPPTAEESAAGHVSSDDFEYIELHNASNQAVDLTGCRFSKGLRHEFVAGPNAVLKPGSSLILVVNEAAFRFRYGDAIAIAGTYGGSLTNGSEAIRLSNPEGEVIQEFEYSDDGTWPITADGKGFSLTLIDPSSNPDASHSSSWQASLTFHGTPGSQETLVSPSIFISEVLANSTAPDVDAIELHNAGTEAVDVSGWFLTDDPSEPSKYAIPQGSSIAAGGYLVILEDNDNDPANNDALPPEFFGSAFGLSSRGDAAHVFSAEADGQLAGYSDGFSFGASEEGVTFGRTVDSQGRVEYPAHDTASLGAANTAPRIGQVVFSEIMYHSPQADDAGEYLELVNRSEASVSLAGWQIGGLGFTFPEGATIAAQEIILVTRATEDNARTLYPNIPNVVTIFDGYDGRLSNDGERLTLDRPGETYLDNGIEKTARITEDSLRYNDAEPWPIAADGMGRSLERTSLDAYADEVMSWNASTAEQGSPGTTDGGVEPQPGLTFAQWQSETFSADQLGYDAIAGPMADPDTDGFINRLEYAFATDPLTSESSAIITAITEGDAVKVRYQRRRNLEGSPVNVEISQDLQSWQAAGAAVTESGTIIINATRETVTLTLDSSMDVRFLRLSVSE